MNLNDEMMEARYAPPDHSKPDPMHLVHDIQKGIEYLKSRNLLPHLRVRVSVIPSAYLTTVEAVMILKRMEGWGWYNISVVVVDQIRGPGETKSVRLVDPFRNPFLSDSMDRAAAPLTFEPFMSVTSDD